MEVIYGFRKLRKLSLPDISEGEKQEKFVEVTISADAPSERPLNFAWAEVHLHKHCDENGRFYPSGALIVSNNLIPM